MGVEFAGLDLHASGAFEHGGAVVLSVKAEHCQGRKLILVGLLGLGQLNLNTVDTIDAVDK